MYSVVDCPTQLICFNDIYLSTLYVNRQIQKTQQGNLLGIVLLESNYNYGIYGHTCLSEFSFDNLSSFNLNAVYLLKKSNRFFLTIFLLSNYVIMCDAFLAQ